MQTKTAGGLLRDARLRHGLSQEALAIRAGVPSVAIHRVEVGELSPKVETLTELLELLGEDLVLDSKKRETGIDLTLNQANLELSAERRVEKGLAFADLVRLTRGGGPADLGISVQPGPLLRPFIRHGVDFVLIGSLAGLVHGSAYPTYDIDLAYARDEVNLRRLGAALRELGVQISAQSLKAPVSTFNTEFGTLDILGQVAGISKYEELRRDSCREAIAGLSVRVASLNHLIAMKRISNRTKDKLMVLEYVELAEEIGKREANDKPD